MLKIIHLTECDFPIVQRKDGDFKMLVIPPKLLRLFEAGYHAVRVHSAKVAAQLPSFGGSTAVGRSQAPHQDHSPRDPRRFLAFSKIDAAPRGSATYLVDPEIVRGALPWLIEQFELRRKEIEREFIYCPPYMVTEEELRQCLEPGGIERLIVSKLGANAPADMRLHAHTGLLTYLLQNRFGDDVVEAFLQRSHGHVWIEEWKSPGLLIVDNARTFHGRRGPNVPLQRNWLLAS